MSWTQTAILSAFTFCIGYFGGRLYRRFKKHYRGHK